MAKVSVIIPIYNSALFLNKCFTALSQQTFKDFDVICVDDYSSDNSIEVAKELVEKKGFSFKIVANEKNIGPSKTRKRGIDISTSEYIAFCDSDDWYESTYLEKMIVATEQGKNEIVFCNYNTIYGGDKVIEHHLVENISFGDKKAIIAKAVDSLCCMLFKRNVFENIDIPDIRNGEDMALIPILISKVDSFGFVNDCLYNYNCREGSQSNSFSAKLLKSLFYSFEYIEENLGKEYKIECEFLGIRNYIYGSLLNLFKNGYELQKAKDIMDVFETKYPKWKKNKYLRELPKYKRIYLLAAANKMFFICRLFSLIHKKFIK